MEKNDRQSNVILYTTVDGQAKLQVKIENETVWLTQDQMAELFDKGRTTITEHIQNAFTEGELVEKSVCREFRRTGTDYKEYSVKHYTSTQARSLPIIQIKRSFSIKDEK